MIPNSRSKLMYEKKLYPYANILMRHEYSLICIRPMPIYDMLLVPTSLCSYSYSSWEEVYINLKVFGLTIPGSKPMLDPHTLKGQYSVQQPTSQLV